MKFTVPSKKDSTFANDLFALILENVSDLEYENEKSPNTIVFMGPIGKEVLNFIKEKEWNFKGFKLESVGGVLDALIFKYNSPLTQKDGKSGVIFDGGSLHGKEISGIPGPETMHKMFSSYSSPSYEIERTVRPEKRIILSR